jgi:putative DNA primase/helicase
VIRLKRAKPGELRTRFDSRGTDKARDIGRKLARFCADQRETLANNDPAMPDGVFNRVADNWRPLFAIAQAAGGDWPRRCAQALINVASHSNMDGETQKVMLLSDIREVITDQELQPNDWIPSGDLIASLTENPERPWSEANRGKPINERWLSVKLVAFGIKPGKLPREGGGQRRGYSVLAFRDAFDRYLPALSLASGQVSQHAPLRAEITETDVETDMKITSVSAIHESKMLCETVVQLENTTEEGD